MSAATIELTDEESAHRIEALRQFEECMGVAERSPRAITSARWASLHRMLVRHPDVRCQDRAIECHYRWARCAFVARAA